MRWLRRGSLFSVLHPQPLLCGLDSACKLESISSDELEKKREMGCGMDAAGGNGRAARGPLCSSFLKAKISQPAGLVSLSTLGLKHQF